jgi:hypothetical protein
MSARTDLGRDRCRQGHAAITTPWYHAPLLSQPQDALDLAYWYQRSLWAQQPDSAADTWQTAVPFWLPPEHSSAFPAGQPLPPDTELRLPFPVIYAALAEPWDLRPRDRDVDYPAQLMMLHGRGEAAGRRRSESLADILGRLQLFEDVERNDLPTPLQMTQRYGARVEGLLLYTDAHGVPTDPFACCLAIGHSLGLPRGRMAVAASRTRTAWRAAVETSPPPSC